jgi:hypothetical protein
VDETHESSDLIEFIVFRALAERDYSRPLARVVMLLFDRDPI